MLRIINIIITSHIYTQTHPFNGHLPGTTRVSRYQKGKTNLDFTGARDSESQWHQLGRVQVCTSLQTDNHASTPPLSFLQTGCPSCRSTNCLKALKAIYTAYNQLNIQTIVIFIKFFYRRLSFNIYHASRLGGSVLFYGLCTYMLANLLQ